MNKCEYLNIGFADDGKTDIKCIARTGTCPKGLWQGVPCEMCWESLKPSAL